MRLRSTVWEEPKGTDEKQWQLRCASERGELHISPLTPSRCIYVCCAPLQALTLTWARRFFFVLAPRLPLEELEPGSSASPQLSRLVNGGGRHISFFGDGSGYLAQSLLHKSWLAVAVCTSTRSAFSTVFLSSSFWHCANAFSTHCRSEGGHASCVDGAGVGAASEGVTELITALGFGIVKRTAEVAGGNGGADEADGVAELEPAASLAPAGVARLAISFCAASTAI